MAWIGAVVGAIGSYASAKEANKSKKTNMTTTREPWGPSAPYRREALDRTYTMLTGKDPLRQSSVPSNYGTTVRRVGPGDSDPNVEGADNANYRNIASESQYAGEGNQDPWRPSGMFDMPQNDYGVDTSWSSANDFFGNSQPIMDALSRRALGGDELYGTSNDYVNSLLTGGGTNPYLDPTYQAFDAYGNDPDLARYKAMLFNGQMPGTDPFGGSGSGGGGGGGYSTVMQIQGGGNGADLVGVKRDIRDVLDKNFLNESNPYTQAMIDKTTRDISKAFQENRIPGINDQFAGAGRFGGGLYATALGDAAGEYTTALGDTVSQLRYQDYNDRMKEYMDAMGYGTQYDMNAINSANDLNARLASSAASSGAAAYGADKDADTRLQIAKLQALQGAIGQGLDARGMGLQGMGALTDLYSQDQRTALGMVPDLSGLDIRDYQAAWEPAFNMDQARNQARAEAAAAAAEARAAAANDQWRWANFNWDREQYFRDEPWRREMQYADLLNAYSNGYGTETSQGTNPGAGVSPFGSALQGGLAGWYAAGGGQGGNGGGGGASYMVYNNPNQGGNNISNIDFG